MSDEEQHSKAMPDGAPQPPARRGIGIRGGLTAALIFVIVLDAIAFVVFPPFPPGEPGAPCPFPVCFIQGTLELPAPEVLWSPSAEPPPPSSGLTITFEPSITNTIFTLWLVTAGLLIFIAFAGRGGAGKPGRLQNFAEWAYEMMDNFSTGVGGLTSRPYVPVFVTFFTGHPKLRSIRSAPAASTMRAASAIVPGSDPKSWIASGCSSDATRR